MDDHDQKKHLYITRGDIRWAFILNSNKSVWVIHSINYFCFQWLVRHIFFPYWNSVLKICLEEEKKCSAHTHFYENHSCRRFRGKMPIKCREENMKISNDLNLYVFEWIWFDRIDFMCKRHVTSWNDVELLNMKIWLTFFHSKTTNISNHNTYFISTQYIYFMWYYLLTQIHWIIAFDLRFPINSARAFKM